MDLHYKVDADWQIDHVAKFRDDRPTELGDPVANLKKTSAVKHKAFRNYRSGWPNKQESRKVVELFVYYMLPTSERYFQSLMIHNLAY